MKVATYLLCIWLTVAFCGCQSESDAPDLVPVSGTVYLDDKPLPDARITFELQGTERSASFAKTDADGKYTLKFGPGKLDGARPGKHDVRISTQDNYTDDSGNDVEIKEIVPSRYNIDTELSQEVSADKADGYDFKLSTK